MGFLQILKSWELEIDFEKQETPYSINLISYNLKKRV